MVCLDTIGMRNICDSNMRLGTCRRLVRVAALMRAGGDPTNLMTVVQDQSSLSSHGISFEASQNPGSRKCGVL